MSSRSIKFNDIVKRSSCINSISESKDISKVYSILENGIENNSNIRMEDIRYYIENMCNIENASNHYYEPLFLISEFNDINPNTSSYIMKEFTTRIIPYIKDLNLLKESIIDYDKLTIEQVEKINEAIKINIASDRILGNHNTFCKRFNIENEAKRYNTVGLKYVVDNCYDLIDTYKAKNYQKFNIAIEEVCYLLDKNGYKYDRVDVVKYTLEHYMSSTLSISNTDKENFMRAISESYILDPVQKENIYLLIKMDNNPDNTSIKNMISNYLSCPEKTINGLYKLINNVLNNTSKSDILNNMDKLVYLIWDLCKNNIFEHNTELYKCMDIIAEYIKRNTPISVGVEEIKMEFTKEDVEKLITTLNDVSKDIREVGNCCSNYSMEASRFIANCINPILSGLKEINYISYPKPNLDSIQFVNNNQESIPFMEFVSYNKFHDLVRSAYNFDKFISVKENRKNIFRLDNFIKKGTNVLFAESYLMEDNIFSFIGEDHKADICIRQYRFNESYELYAEKMSEFLSEICKEYNTVLESCNIASIKSYYIINPGLAEIRLKESTYIDFDDSNMIDEIRSSIDPAFMEYINIIEESNKLCDMYESILELYNDFIDFSDCNFTKEHFDLALECMSYLDIDNDYIKLFGRRLSDSNYTKALNYGNINEVVIMSSEKYITESINNIDIKKNVPIEIQLEAYDLLLAIFNEAGKPLVGGKAIEARKNKKYDDWDSDDYDDNEEDDPEKKSTNQKKDPIDVTRGLEPYKNQSKGGKVSRSLNNIKLAIKGLATKMKHLGTKEKELCRNMDNASAAFIKSTKDFFTNDRRESIIKGSVIPSFSRCIKAGIAFAGLSLISLPLGIIAAIGAIGISKKLNQKERGLLLDEIETELDVIDKELSIAESNSDMKKYRDLLKYKKALQRQYQRIRYNIRVGKDLPHLASDGMRGTK